MTINRGPRNRKIDPPGLERPPDRQTHPSGRADRLVAGYPGQAIVVDRGGRPLASNDKGADLLNRIAAGEFPSIAPLLHRAFDEEAAVSSEALVPGPETEQVLDIEAIPVFDGQAALLLVRDLTLERNLRAALADSRQRYKDLVEISSDFSWEVGPEGTFTFMSPRGALGYSASDLIGRRPEALVRNVEDYDPLPFKCHHPMEGIEVWLRRADGSDSCVLVSSLPLHTSTGDVAGARGVCRDVTDDRNREAILSRLQHRERMINYVTKAIRDKVEPLDMLSAAASATASALGASGCHIFRRTPAGTYATAASFGDSGGIDSLESSLARQEEAAGSSVQMDVGGWRTLVSASYHQKSMNGAVAVWKPTISGDWSVDDQELLANIAGQLGIVNEQISNHERVLALSRSDGMTGLLNRRTFLNDDLPRRLSRLHRAGQMAALFYIDLDNFKAVNDVHGHSRGDEAILTLRDLLVEFSRPRDVIARLGGDEFAMWLDGITTDVACRRAQELLAASQVLTSFSGSADRPLGISVGVAIYDPASAETLNDLMARADGAMYIAKRRGKSSFAIAPPAVGLATNPK